MNSNKFSKKKPNCYVERTLEVIGAKWTVLVIRELLGGKKRFGELQRELDGISPRTLSLRLSVLEEEGIIIKKIFPVVPLHVEYRLTKRGLSLAGILKQMHKWGETHRIIKKQG